MLTYNMFLEKLILEDVTHFQDRVEERIRNLSDIKFSDYAIKNAPVSYLEQNKEQIKNKIIAHFFRISKKFVQTVNMKTLDPNATYIIKFGGIFTKQVDDKDKEHIERVITEVKWLDSKSSKEVITYGNYYYAVINDKDIKTIMVDNLIYGKDKKLDTSLKDQVRKFNIKQNQETNDIRIADNYIEDFIFEIPFASTTINSGEETTEIVVDKSIEIIEIPEGKGIKVIGVDEVLYKGKNVAPFIKFTKAVRKNKTYKIKMTQGKYKDLVVEAKLVKQQAIKYNKSALVFVKKYIPYGTSEDTINQIIANVKVAHLEYKGEDITRYFMVYENII